MAFQYWNPSDKHADITLLDSGERATCTTANRRGVRSIDWNRDSKFYVEFIMDKTNGTIYGQDLWVGIGNSAIDLSDQVDASFPMPYFVIGIDDNQLPYGRASFRSGTEGPVGNWVNAGPASWGDESVVMMAVDFEAGKLWFGIDGVWFISGNPATGANPTWNANALRELTEFYCICSCIGGGDPTEATLVSDPTDHSYSTPAGFQSGWFHPTHYELEIQADLGVSALVAGVREFEASIVASVGASFAEGAFNTSDEITGAVGAGEVIEGQDPYGDITGGAGAGAAVVGLNTTCQMSGQAGLDDDMQIVKEHHPTLTEGLAAGETIEASQEISVDIAAGAGMGAAFDVFNYTTFLKDTAGLTYTVYECTLTGANDGQSDLYLPISSLQSTIRNDAPTYLSVVVPVYEYLDEISLRPNGELIVDSVVMIDGVEQLRELLSRVDLEEVRTSRGGRNESITLSGHKTETWGNQLISLQNPSEAYLLASGKLKYRADVDLYLRPGDTVDAGDAVFIAGTVSMAISVQDQRFEVTEA